MVIFLFLTRYRTSLFSGLELTPVAPQVVLAPHPLLPLSPVCRSLTFAAAIPIRDAHHRCDRFLGLAAVHFPLPLIVGWI